MQTGAMPQVALPGETKGLQAGPPVGTAGCGTENSSGLCIQGGPQGGGGGWPTWS
jgi:hypothetical protein